MCVGMSVNEMVGIGAVLGRIDQIRTMASAPLMASPASAAAGTAMPPAMSATAADPGMPFAMALSRAQGTGAAGPTTAAGVIAATPGAAEMAAQIDEWIARKNPDSPLQGYGAVFVREGTANGIDPRALAAIARAESGLGSDPGARSIHNAFGWGPHRPFASWEENIATVAAGLRRGYLEEGLVTLGQIQQKYCPVGAANDPTGLNSNWLRNTTILYAELGGDPAGTVAVAPGGVSAFPGA